LLSRAEHEDILLSAFITDANAEALHGDVTALYALLVHAVTVLSANGQVMSEAANNAFDSFVSGSVKTEFGTLLARVCLKGPADQAAFAMALQKASEEGKQMRDRAFRAVARCVFNRAVF
jgi:hypothetical protein